MGEASVIGPRPIAPLSAADIKDEIWLEIGRYNAEAPPRRQAAQQQVQAAPQPVVGPLALPALLALDGAAFIRAAYQTVLERAPDEAGIAHFTRQMEAGVSKIVLLGGLQRSAEGRQSGRAVAGLRRRYMAQRLYGVPVVGPGVRLAGFVLRQGGMSGHLGGTVRASRQQVQAALLDRVNASQEALERRARVQDAAIDALARRLEIIQVQHAESAAGLQKTLAEQARRIGLQESAGERSLANAATQGRSLSALASQSLAMGRRLGEMEDSSMESLLAMSDALDQQKLRLSQIEATLQAEAAQDVAMEDGVPGLRQSQAVRLARAEALLVQNREAMIEQERRVGVLVEALRTRSEALPVAVQQQDDHAVDSLYVEFEDRFRGTRADIKDRLRFYLPILAESGAGAPDRPVLDVGCGRGEFLELLREEGLSASGVDANAAMAESCRSHWGSIAKRGTPWRIWRRCRRDRWAP